MNRYLFFTIIVLSFILNSCSTETGVEPTDETNPVKATYSSIGTLVLDNSCAKSGCHLSSVNPILKSDVAYNNIVGKKNFAGTLNYIEPGKPDSSYLFQKIIENGNRSGSRMPRDGDANGFLSAAELDSIRVWIENGALNN